MGETKQHHGMEDLRISAYKEHVQERKCHLHLFVPCHLKHNRRLKLFNIFNWNTSLWLLSESRGITTAEIQYKWNTIDCHVPNMTGKIEKLQMINVSKKYLRKIILSRRCSSTRRCAPFGVASTFQNHREWLMITKNKNYQ